jgi:PKHD-type hydroxylase
MLGQLLRRSKVATTQASSERAQAQHDFSYVFPSRCVPDAHGAMQLQWADPAGAFGQKRPLPLGVGSSTVHGVPQALSMEECHSVVAVGEALPRNTGRVELGPDAYRVSHIAWIEPEPDTHWLFHRLAMLFAQANEHYGFELTGFVEALQYTRYGPEQHFDWHLDIGAGQTSARKLSLSIQLSESDDYAGGELEFISLTTGDEARRPGTAIFFPAYMAHRVSPVTRGVRRSLVAWAYGPSFR